LALTVAALLGKRSIADRIALLEQASKRLAEGNLEVRVGNLMAGGELGKLGESFDAMAERLASREASLSDSQRFLNTVINTEPDCVKLLDVDGRVLMMNPAGLEIVGVDSIEQIKGKSIYPLISTEYREAFKQLTKDVFQGRSGRLEFEADNMKGRHLWLGTNVVPFRNDRGEIVSLLGITRDITDRKAAQKALAASESAFRATFEQAAVGMARVAPDGSWLEVNQRLCDIVGYSRYELLTSTYQDIMHPGDLDSDLGFVKQVLVGEINTYSKEMRIFRKDRAAIWVYFTVGVVRDARGAPAYSISVVEDITQRKRAEDLLAEKQGQLEVLNISLAKRVEEAVAELRRKDQILIAQGRQAAMGEMIGNIAHQWRQPLNTLALTIQEVKMLYPHDDIFKDTLNASVGKAMHLIAHMSKTIDDFSNYFKPDKEKQLFLANKSVANALALVETSLANLNVSVERKECTEIFINGYPNEYTQVLLNILLNCRDAFEGGPKTGRRVIGVAVFAEADKSIVTIADNAGGIPQDIMNKIFDPYFTTKGPDKGTGIGLYMAKTIIEKNMGGKLSVRNTPEGAEFRIEV
jgi:PAS domain S-box-containing protein